MKKRNIILLIILIQFLLSSIVFCQTERLNKNFYESEQNTWLEFIRNYESLKNDSNINVTFYHLNLDINIESPFIQGNVLTRFLIDSNNVDKIYLNLENSFTIDSIKGNVKTYTFTDNVITIKLDKVYMAGDSSEVTIYYSGIPALAGGIKGLVYETHGNNEPIIASLSTPFLAHYWWPCKDGPNDKPDSVYIDITIPDTTVNNFPLIAVSNGVLENTTNSNGKNTFHWRERYPITTYYVMVAISNFEKYQQIYSDSTSTSFPIDYYTFAENLDQTITGVEELPEVINLFSKLFGEYPFAIEKYGMTELGFYGGIENQTNTVMYSMSLGMFDTSVHELAHMWFGDMITCADWHHGWLNEGFATYCGGLWIEHKYGFQEYKDYIKSIQYFYSGSVYLQDDSDPFNIFIQIIYYKGANVLNMLRGVLGDSLFFSSLSKYSSSEEFRYKQATTEDFKNICEEVSGMNLTKFFQQWIYGEYYPSYVYGYSVDSLQNSYRINLEIDQVQVNTDMFLMPIDIKVTTSSGEHLFVVWDSLQTQTYELEVSDKPILLEFDPDNWILKRVSKKIYRPSLDKGLLLVNGLDWAIGSEVYEAYSNKAFWGNTKISFWDIYNEPIQGYPSTLPETIGNGQLSDSVIGNYSTIVWLSDYRSDDLKAWRSLPIESYIKSGGNVILITKRGRGFINTDLKNLIGLNWDEKPVSVIKNIRSVNNNFTDIGLISDNSLVALFDTTLTQDYSELIYVSTESLDSPKGSGVWSKPEGMGQFVYIAGRPYKLNHSDLSSNLQNILVGEMGEIVCVDDKKTQNIPSKFELFQNYPNPFNPTTQISYSLPQKGLVGLKVYDVLGREIADLVGEEQAVGNYKVEFNASNLSSGIYFYRLQSGGFSKTKKLVLVR